MSFPATSTLADCVISAVSRHGIDTVFGIPGVHTLEYYRALSSVSMRVIAARHEQGAAFMADGYARACGRPGAVSVITGPGLTNAATGIGQAWADSVPMLVLTTRNSDPGRRQLHELRSQASVARGLADAYHEPGDVTEAERALAEVFAEFRAGRPRPAIVSVERERLAAGKSGGDRKAPRSREPPTPGTDEIAKVVSALGQARAPVVLVGGGCTEAATQVRALVDRLRAPVLTSVAGKGVVPSSSPLCLGSVLPAVGVATWLRERDLVLALGTELAPTDTERERTELPGRLIRVDVDPAELADDRYPAQLPVHADVGRFCEALLTALPARFEATAWDPPRDTEVPWVRAHHREALAALRSATDPGTRFVTDMTQLAYAGNVVFPVEEPRLWLHPTGFGSLGFAVPAAIGAALADPGRQVVAVVGDSGLLYTGQELATAAELCLPITVVVWNNAALGQIRDDMARLGIPPLSVHPHNGDIQALARALGCASERVESAAQLRDAVARAQKRGTGPTVIEMAVAD